MKCSICGKKEGRYVTETWKMENGPSVEVPRSLEVSVEDPRNPDDKIICEECYQANRLTAYRDDELLEINTQFGIEYIRAGQLEKAEAAFRKAISIKVTAEGLSQLAYCLNYLGNKTDARKLYLMALDIDPNHFMATSNLAQLEKSG